MWTAIVAIVGSLMCVAMIIASVAVGFTFFVVPIVVADLMFIAAVYLMRRAFAAEERVPPTRQQAWYLDQRNSPPRPTERLGERHAGHRDSSSRGATAVRGSGQAPRVPRPVRRTPSS